MRVEIEGLRKSYGDTNAVDSIDLVAAEGELTTLLGPSGCGKTTTLRCVAGLEETDAGTITIGDTLIEDPSKGVSIPTQQRNVGFVFQSFDVWPHMSTFDNVAYPLRVRDLPKSEIERRVTDILELTGIADLREKQASVLSGGQRARVGLCRALVYEPKVLLCDEPLTGLDRNLRKRLQQELRRIQTELNITTLYVTHDQPEAMALSDRIALLNTEGTIEQVGPPETIYERPVSKYAFDFIGDTQTLPGMATEPGTVDTALGPISCSVGEHDGEVLVGFRPESITLLDGEQDEVPENMWTGTVQNEYYLGDAYELDVTIDGELLQIRIRADRYDSMNGADMRGREIQLAIDPTAVHVFGTTNGTAVSRKPDTRLIASDPSVDD